MGVIFFSFASGSLTQIIANYDETNAKNVAKLNILNKILKEHHIPPKVYTQIEIQIDKTSSAKQQKQKLAFLDGLPFRLKIRATMYLYRESYEKIIFLQNQSDAFIAWVCPLLIQIYIPEDQYIYYETDMIDEVYFLTKGSAGFVLPLKCNIVFIEILIGDTFGEIDFVVAS